MLPAVSSPRITAERPSEAHGHPNRTRTTSLQPTSIYSPASESQSHHDTIPKVPPHWINDFTWLPFPLSTICEAVFKIICLLSFGYPSFEGMWSVCYPGVEDEVWLACRDSQSQRISIITVVAGLMLGATGAFVTTVSPVLNMLNYNARGPYICLVASFGITLGGLIVGSAEVFIMAKCPADWFRETLMGTRSNTYCTILFISYPFFAIGISTILAAFDTVFSPISSYFDAEQTTLGLLVAAWHSPDPVIRHGSVFLLLAPASLIPLFVWTQLPNWKERPQDNSKNA